MAHLTMKEAEREDAPNGRSSQVGLGANKRDNRQKEEEKVILPLGNTDIQSVKPVNPAIEKNQKEEKKETRKDLHALMHTAEMGPTTEESILSLS
jgi:hypothetical protein